jgi:ribokinase
VTVQEPFSVTAVDTTAAGDAFAGVLGSALAEGLDWEQSLHRAMAGGALAVTVAGASPSLPRRDAIDAFLERQPAAAR